MKKINFLFIFFLFTGLLFSQVQVVEDFEEPTDSLYWQVFNGDNADSAYTRMDATFQNTEAVSGNAMSLDWSAQNSESWGGFTKIEHMRPDSLVYDWSMYDSVSFWFYNQTAQTLPARTHLRFNIYDVSDVPDTTSSANACEFYYSFHYNVLDATPGWNEIKIPLIADPNFWNGEGFNRTGWSGVVGNDHLDADKIKGFAFEFSISGGGEGDFSEGVLILDELTLKGIAEDPWLIFNGKTLDPTLGQFTWGQSSLEIVEGGGEDPATNSVKWTQGNEWSNGYSGAGWNVNPAHNLSFRWDLDSLLFSMKTEGTVGTLRLQFESGADGKIGINMDPINDGAWHKYALALADFVDQEGTTNFNAEAINVFQFLGEGTAVAGNVVYFDFIWTGNPEIDVVEPLEPTNVIGVTGSYQNLVTWLDVPGEDDGTYTVYYSSNPITESDAEGVEQLAKGIVPGTQIVTHVLKAPMVDQSVTYYYAVRCVDAAGNDGALGFSDAVTNTAEGITTIHPVAPVGFVADGEITEWADIPEFRMYPSDGSGTIVNNTTIDGDADLSLDAYVAFDDNYLYFAFDVADDIVSTDTTIASYLQDSPDLYLGLYDWHGESHTGYKRGEEPDYHFRFNVNQMIIDNLGAAVVDRIGENYFWKNKFPSGYVVEGRISLDSLSTLGGDYRFHPAVGMRIPFDISVNDADATGEREGILTYSINNQDQSWSDVSRWTYTWIGDQMTGLGDENSAPSEFSLSQNYPNPFNPTTTINYNLKNSGLVSLKIFNVLGQEVMTVVNQVQNAGTYNVTFDASKLASGVYVYRLQSGSFISTKKMMLLK